MKRSRTLVLTGVMAAGGVSLAACDSHMDQGKPVDSYTYASLQECLDKKQVPADQCQAAEQTAKIDEQKSARYGDQTTCEDVYGPGQCVPRGYNNGGGGSFWGPLITGFVVGRMLDGGWHSRGLYRDWRDGGYYTTSGGRVWTDYSTGHSRIGSRGFDPPDVMHAPPKAMSRASVISRGGFGGRMSSFGGRGGWGG
ncbi:MAG TPA: DUF1190 domain-containing protein [Phenylobacterium sp.]|nr:DUF1190 domain-containing protein [Phenylobacterium sp.]